MEEPKVFLLRKIVEHKKNGLSTLGELNAKHIDDLAQVLQDYGREIIQLLVDSKWRNQNKKQKTL